MTGNRKSEIAKKWRVPVAGNLDGSNFDRSIRYPGGYGRE